MAVITKVSPSIDPMTAQYAVQITGLYAGAALAVNDAVYLASADGLVYPCDATAATEPAEFLGVVARPAAIGEPVTIFGPGTRMRYGAGLTPGDLVYVGVLADAAGSLNDAATVGDAVGVGVILNATDILITRTFAG